MSKFDASRPDEIEAHLAVHAYLGGSSPSEEDGALLLKLKNYPVKKTHPNFYHYY